MADPFKQLILDQVGMILKKTPNQDTLYELLKIASPKLKYEEVRDEGTRNTAYKLIRLRIHPDKHRNAAQATKLFQDVQVFFDQSCRWMRIHPATSKKEERSASAPPARGARKPRSASAAAPPPSPKPPAKQSVGSNKSDSKNSSSRPQATAAKSSQPQTSRTAPQPNQRPTTRATSTPPVRPSQAPAPQRQAPSKSVTGKSVPVELASNGLPTSFRVEDKWSQLKEFKAEPSAEASCSERDVYLGTAACCINSRGYVVHGSPTSRSFVAAYFEKRGFQSVEDVFDGIAEGVRKLRTVDAIKKEIYERGPIVSLSFKLEEAFLRASENAHTFISKLIGRKHPVLLTGWKLTAFGEVWIIRTMRESNTGSDNIVAFGQFGIDDECVSPVSNLDNMSWQRGAYFAHNLPDNGWRKLRTMDIYLTNTELQHLCGCFDTGFAAAIRMSKLIHLHPKEKKAESRQCHITDLDWVPAKERWKVTLKFKSH